MKNLAVFGSTGSIGRQTLSVVQFHRNEFNIKALVAGSNVELILEQIALFRPSFVGMYCSEAAKVIRERHPELIVVSGDDVNMLASLPEVDIVVNGVSGFAGLAPLLSALRVGKTVALANKESIVCAHHVIDSALETYKGRILPVDSEQSAIFQCLTAGRREDVKRLILTASGGMFRDASIEDLAAVTPEMAMHHPTWNMGRKITIDSSSLFNKGLELMEAGWLFGFSAEQIDILIHPQSIVHSMVEYKDGSVIAQLSPADMRLAIQYAMTYPKRILSELPKLDLTKLSALTFDSPDPKRFPAIALAYEAFREGEVLPIAYNASNEVAVEHFIRRDIGFTDIAKCVENTMNRMIRSEKCVDSLEKVYAIDIEARNLAETFCKNNH